MINFLKECFLCNFVLVLSILSGICFLGFAYFHDILFFGFTREMLLSIGYILLVFGLSTLISQRITHHNKENNNGEKNNEEDNNKMESCVQEVSEQKSKAINNTQDEKMLKDVAFYETYLSNSLSSDQQLIKQLLTASFFAIGFMVPLLYNSKVNFDSPLFLIWAVATFLFLTSFCILLINLVKLGDLYRTIFGNEKKPIPLGGEEKEKNIRDSIGKLDPLIYSSFVIAVALSVIFVFFAYIFYPPIKT